MREREYLTAAVEFLEDKGVELWGVNQNPEQVAWTDSPKAYAHVYVDDAALGCPLAYEVLEGGKNSRPFVDWTIVGPMVLERIRLFDAGGYSIHPRK